MGHDKTHDRSAASPNPKDGASPSERFYIIRVQGEALGLFVSGLSLEKAWIPAPDRGGGPRRRV